MGTQVSSGNCLDGLFHFSIMEPTSKFAKREKVLSYKMENLVKYVNPLSGTEEDGNEYPGATMPFGMIQWSPDSGPQRRMGGYNCADSVIYGFSVDHLSGAGCFYGGDIAFSPLLGTEEIVPPVSRLAFPEPFSHANETAHPSYYSVKLNNGIEVELTATERTGFGRFTYPNDGTPTIVINAGSNIINNLKASVRINLPAWSISGAATGGHFCSTKYDTRTIYFYAVFGQPFAHFGTWGDSTLLNNGTIGEGKTAGTYVTFDLSKSRTVLAKIGISYVSVENARRNLESENSISRFSVNDDLGEMSSWYIFGVLGMYPEPPGSNILVIGSPLFPKEVLHLKTGDVVIEGRGAGASAPYVRSLTVNGKKWNKPWIGFSDISKGATLIYDLSRTPSKEWGSAPEDVPPSYN